MSDKRSKRKLEKRLRKLAKMQAKEEHEVDWKKFETGKTDEVPEISEPVDSSSSGEGKKSIMDMVKKNKIVVIIVLVVIVLLIAAAIGVYMGYIPSPMSLMNRGPKAVENAVAKPKIDQVRQISERQIPRQQTQPDPEVVQTIREKKQLFSETKQLFDDITLQLNKYYADEEENGQPQEAVDVEDLAKKQKQLQSIMKDLQQQIAYLEQMNR